MDIMTTDVVTTTVDTTVSDAATLMLTRRISGLPVVDGKGALVGIVSEGDLMSRSEIGTADKRSWWLRLFSSSEEDAQAFLKSHGRTVGDVMSASVVTVKPDTDIAEIAEKLEARGIKRLPVVENGRVVGIVSRANVLQGLATKGTAATAGPTVSDSSIRTAIVERLLSAGFATHGAPNPVVNNGVVELWGWVESEKERKAMCTAAGEIEGVKQVVDRLAIIPAYQAGT